MKQHELAFNREEDQHVEEDDRAGLEAERRVGLETDRARRVVGSCTTLDHVYPGSWPNPVPPGTPCFCGKRRWGVEPTRKDKTP